MNKQLSFAIRIDKTLRDKPALAQNFLPADFQWSTTLVSILSRADYLLGKLSNVKSTFLDPHLFLPSLRLREAVSSNRIEGSRATIREICLNEAGAYVDLYPRELKQVENYDKALNYGIEHLKDEPLSLPLLQKVQQVLEHDINSYQRQPREMRTKLRVIHSSEASFPETNLVPSQQENLKEDLEKLRWIFQDKLLPPLIQCALSHFQFVTLLPSLRSNRQVGRLLIPLLLIERKILPLPLLSMSAYFEATREEYDKHLNNVILEGNLNEWLMYFLSGITAQTEDTLDRLQRLNDLLSNWSSQITRSGTSVLRSIVQNLMRNPYILITKVAQDLGVNYTTVQKAIHRLEATGILRNINESKWGRIYCAEKVLSILEEPTRVKASELIY